VEEEARHARHASEGHLEHVRLGIANTILHAISARALKREEHVRDGE
jgi:hypothetical protein